MAGLVPTRTVQRPAFLVPAEREQGACEIPLAPVGRVAGHRGRRTQHFNRLDCVPRRLQRDTVIVRCKLAGRIERHRTTVRNTALLQPAEVLERIAHVRPQLGRVEADKLRQSIAGERPLGHLGGTPEHAEIHQFGRRGELRRLDGLEQPGRYRPAASVFDQRHRQDRTSGTRRCAAGAFRSGLGGCSSSFGSHRGRQ